MSGGGGRISAAVAVAPEVRGDLRKRRLTAPRDRGHV